MSSGGSNVMRGCGTFLGLWTVWALVVGIFFYVNLPAQEVGSRLQASGYAGIGSGFFMAFASSLVFEVRRRFREVTLLRDSVAGVPPTDGARIAAYGTLVADGPLLEAPMTGARAAIYKYEIMARRKKSDDDAICSGYALTPCHIETAGGNVRILGYAEPAFAAELPDGAEVRARTQAYLASTNVTPIGMDGLKESLNVLLDDDGSIKSDTGAVVELADNPRVYFREYAVADRETVCAFGVYSVERGGLVPAADPMDPYPVRLRRGDAAAVRRSIVKSAIGQSLGAVLMVALAVGAGWIVRLMFVQ